MIEQQIVDRFIVLRSQGKTFAQIAAELNVSRGTLVNWSRKHRFEIQNFRAMELEDIRDKLLQPREIQAQALARELQRVEEELKKRDLSEVPTARLYALAENLRRQIERELGEVQFTTPIKDIPSAEYCEEVQDWAP